MENSSMSVLVFAKMRMIELKSLKNFNFNMILVKLILIHRGNTYGK